MTNALYPKYKEALLSTGVNLSSGNVKVLLIDTASYTYSASHQYLSDVATAARVATSGNLASKTVASGVFDAADLTITTVSGATVESIIMFRDSGTEGTSELVAYIDQGTGFVLTPSGGDVVITWSASGIFTL